MKKGNDVIFGVFWLFRMRLFVDKIDFLEKHRDVVL